MNPTPEQVIQFLEDEGLASPIKTENLDKLNWQISINEPWESDTKRRCGIAQVRIDDKWVVVFNSFKASAIMGDDYKGSFWKFVKLVKDFESNQDAKSWFIKNYVLKGNIKNFLIQDRTSHKVSPSPSLDIPDYFIKFKFQDEFKQYVEYLEKRKITKNIIKKYKIFINNNHERIVFPVYENSELIFYTARAINDDDPIPWLKSKGHNIHPIWNLENVNGDTINIFEGIFDAILVPNSIALLGASNITEPYIEKILYKNYLRINLIFDNDTAGHIAKYKLAYRLQSEGHKNIWVYNFKGIKQKDFNQMKMENIDFDFNNRLVPWSLKTEVLIKTGAIV